ncbi:binding partner of ACD11 1 isoform X4 [Helianthus annuus]|uniref:binding partner of ACD11 1 isoform X4 n=1 Tax=Helianthus annuus TaxID=4232 RepID=UPI0016532279|nr:binding partner of ACD11 1 isoform X4 [Helianthus annuus]
MAATESKTETEVPPTTGNASETKTVEVSNVSMTVTEKDIREFFSFSGNIHYVEMKSESETTQRAFVTFKESKGAHTALLLTTDTDGKSEVAQQAEEVVSTMLAKGFVLGKDALQKAKSFDEKHQLTSNASATAVSIDQKMGLTQKLSTGTAVVNEKMKEVDERYQVSEATKSAVTKAEKKANDAGSALMSNKYVSNGAVWIAGAFAAVAKAAEGVGSKTKKKVHEAEEEKEGSKTKDSVQKAEGSNKDSSVSPVKPSNENNKLPNQ